MGKGEKRHMTFIGHFRNKKLATKRIEKVMIFKAKKSRHTRDGEGGMAQCHQMSHGGGRRPKMCQKVSRNI
jgi:hypothetical protein